MKNPVILILFLILVVGVGLLIGVTTLPGAWYAALAKPSFNPPNWIFAPVWTVLYIMIAIAGWRTWTRHRHGGSMQVWIVQLALNFLWSPTFFAAHWTGAALIVILLLLVSIIAFIAMSWRRDALAAWLFVPYALWVAFASLLNASIWHLN